MDAEMGDIEVDSVLFSAIREGKRDAFESLFQRYYPMLCRYAATYLDEREETEDAVQDVFVYLWNNRQTLVMPKSVRSYLYTSVKHRALNILKHRAVERSHSRLLTEFIEDLSRTEYSEEEQAQIEQIRHVLSTLPQQCRTVFTMSCLEGKKYKEIAEELRISVNTVKYHILKAYRDIRESITIPGDISTLLFIACFLERQKETNKTK